jgi:protease-4
MVAALILAGLLIVSLLANLVPLLHAFTLTRPGYSASRLALEETTVEDHDSHYKIAVVELLGIITGDAWDRSGRGLVEFIKDQLRLAGEDSRVKAVIFKIDSPGGEVLASDDINRAVAEFQNKYGKPVVASMGGLAASGGYYAAVPCRWIVANELTITGSIGVVLHSYNYRGLLNKVGVRPEVFKSGKFKDMLSGEKLEEDILPEEKRMVQDLIDETFARFKKVVQEGRSAAHARNGSDGRALADTWETYADGRILSGRQAHEYGFVDELGTFDTAAARARKLAGIPDANLIRYQRPFDLGSLFRLFGQSDARALKLDLGMDLPRLQAGRLYFLSPTVLH